MRNQRSSASKQLKKKSNESRDNSPSGSRSGDDDHGGRGKETKGGKRRKKQHRRQVTDHKYFHGHLPNDDVLLILKDDGDFILRSYVPDKDPEADPQLLLTVYWGGKLKNAPIREVTTKKKTRYMLGQEGFDSVDALIDNYYIRKLMLKMGEDVIWLQTPVGRQPWELRHAMVKIDKNKQLGEGAYGRVYKGTLQRHPEERPIEVAVKELWNTTPEASAEIWKEARIMRRFDHPHVVKMYGVCNDRQPFLLVTEFIRGGSLDKYLETRGKSLKTLDAKKRIQLLLEGAQGIDYIHSKKTIHRDIGARNFLIDDVVKVADFGLARNIKRKGNYKINPDADCNLRWIAPDAFKTGVVDWRTDAYAFGVTIWEVFKIPYEKPYEGWSGTRVYDEVVEKGFRLSRTEHMPNGVANLMKECLSEPKSRPNFQTIVTCLHMLYKDPAANLGLNV